MRTSAIFSPIFTALVLAATASGAPDEVASPAAVAKPAAEAKSAAAAKPAAEAKSAAAAKLAQSCRHAGLKLPKGFCASVFADDVGHARHLSVAANGVVYVNTWSGSYYANSAPRAGGFIVALQDTGGAGKANVVERFGPAAGAGGHGGTGIALYKGALYVEESDRIERYALTAGSIVPQGRPEVIVSGLPLTGDHPMHPFVIDADGALYVDVASATNACQERNRQLEAPGIQPCTELETRGGIWRYDANRTGQQFSRAERYATGIRNADGVAVDASGHGIYATQHGRDQLHQNWPALYKPEEEATQPAEELLKVKSGGDYGWPECYFDEVQRRLVLAPEYGGDGGKALGPCGGKQPPVASFPAHWAPNDLVIYTGESFPAHYHEGAFIAFHGSWDRAPYPQGGYNVVFQPLSGATAAARCEIFAEGFAGAVMEPGRAAHRPSGVAVSPDGALYISDDQRGRIYRVVYRGAAGSDAGALKPCPPADAPAGPVSTEAERPPEGVHANAGRSAANLPVPPGSSRQMVEKQYRSPMPPMGGAQLTPEQTSAVAAYVWALSHR
jgi:glucose/arabinose dehydrogenase